MANNGWIKVHRSLLDHPQWLAEPFTKAQAWVDLLLLANYKAGCVNKRGITIEVKRGQVAWSEEALAKRWRWSRGKVRRFLKELIKEGQVSRKIVQKNPRLSSLITIDNYDYYQSGDTKDGTTNGTMYKKEENGKKTPFEISEEISGLSQKYDATLLQETIKSISYTRKSNRIAESVKLRILQNFDRYTVNQVEAGMKVYLDKNYASQGKDEQYLIGIIRNNGQGEEPIGKIMQSTGSVLLDEHYRQEGYTIR